MLLLIIVDVFMIYHHYENSKNPKQEDVSIEELNEQAEPGEQAESNGKAEDGEQDNIYDVLVENEPGIDEDMARWLCEHYTEACNVVAKKMESGDYQAVLWYEETGKSLFVLKDEAAGILESEQSMKEHLIYKKDCAVKDYVSLSFAGDVSFANDYTPAQNYTREGIDGAFSADLQQTMADADVFMLNNEFCYSTGGSPVPKGYNFRAAPERVERLHEMGVDIVSIANNHAFDYGAEAFIEAGADVIVGGHPHCLQGVEYYMGVPIFYSLSNFSFSSKTVNSAVLNLQVTIEGILQARYIPCLESGGKTHQCDEQDADYTRIIKLLNDVSANAVIDEDGIVQGMGY